MQSSCWGNQTLCHPIEVVNGDLFWFFIFDMSKIHLIFSLFFLMSILYYPVLQLTNLFWNLSISTQN